MGTRTAYRIIDNDGELLATVYSNCSHPEQNAEDVFRRLCAQAKGPSALLQYLMGQCYSGYGGNHRDGDRMFHLVSAKIIDDGDIESVLQAVYEADGSFKVTTPDPQTLVSGMLPMPKDLFDRVSESYQWSKTSLLKGDALERYGEANYPGVHDNLRLAEHETHIQAMAWIVDNVKPATGRQMLVDAGALNMVVNALRRDAEEGKAVRGEMADELMRTARTL